MTERQGSWKIATFVVLTLGISAIFYAVMARTGSTREVVLGWMWSPGMGAILTQLLFRGRLRDLGWGPGAPKYLLLGTLIPLVYALGITSLVWVTGLGGFQPQPPLRVAASATVGFVAACLASLAVGVIFWRKRGELPANLVGA